MRKLRGLADVPVVRLLPGHPEGRGVRYLEVLRDFIDSRCFVALMRESPWDLTASDPPLRCPVTGQVDPTSPLLWAEGVEGSLRLLTPEEVEVMDEWFHEHIVLCLRHED